jgi:hypothetical protein
VLTEHNPDLHLRIGREELVIRQRYQVISIANDVLIGLWFLIGSFMFFSEILTYSGTWLFVIGSVEMLIRPVIRLIRHLHLQRLRSPAAAGDDSFDY